jgi:hypothetical protein
VSFVVDVCRIHVLVHMHIDAFFVDEAVNEFFQQVFSPAVRAATVARQRLPAQA